MIGIAASTTASIELQISGSDMRHAENFYKAEAAAMAGASAVEGTDKDILERPQIPSGRRERRRNPPGSRKSVLRGSAR